MSADGDARPTLRVCSVDVRERPVTLRLPFRFGAVTLTEAPQLFVRVGIETAGGHAQGFAAELLAPKWFDKNPALSNEANFEQLRRSVRHAARLYRSAPDPFTAFALHASRQSAHYAACASDGLGRLVASYGTALLDRAVLDALCRLHGLSVFEAVRANLPGITADTTPDLYGTDLDRHLAAAPSPDRIAVRHTLGMADAIRDDDLLKRLDDGLPESLEAAVATHGLRYFKLKLGGDVAADVRRLVAVAELLDGIGEGYHVSLDGNEQFADAAAVGTLLDAIEAEPRLQRLWASTLYIEQPIARVRTLREPVHALAARKPLAVDESDAHVGVFPVARALGYGGISSKSCKGVYRALLNAARVARWNAAADRSAEDGAPGDGPPCFIIAEDLSTQAGIAVQQDFALAALVGASHVERNGHHYVDGFGDAPASEQQRFAATFPDLYRTGEDGRVRLAIEDGSVSLASLEVPGFAVVCGPEWSSLRVVTL